MLILSEYAMQPVLELAPNLNLSTGSPLQIGRGILALTQRGNKPLTQSLFTLAPRYRHVSGGGKWVIHKKQTEPSNEPSA